MTNIRFNLPENVIEELNEYVQMTMPEGYASSVINLIKYGLYHLDKATRYMIYVESPSTVLNRKDADPSEIIDEILESFSGIDGATGTIRLCYQPSADDMMLLEVTYSKKLQIQQVISKIHTPMIPLCELHEAEDSISLMYTPSMTDRGNAMYDMMDRLDDALERGSGVSVHSF